MSQQSFMSTDCDQEPACDSDAHVWTSRNGKPIIEGDKCDCGEATWTDPEIPEDQAQAARGAPRLPGM